jgi:hypothetical protein
MSGIRLKVYPTGCSALEDTQQIIRAGGAEFPAFAASHLILFGFKDFVLGIITSEGNLCFMHPMRPSPSL